MHVTPFFSYHRNLADPLETWTSARKTLVRSSAATGTCMGEGLKNEKREARGILDFFLVFLFYTPFSIMGFVTG